MLRMLGTMEIRAEWSAQDHAWAAAVACCVLRAIRLAMAV